MFRFLRPEAFTNDFESVVSGASFPVNNKVIANIDVVKSMEHFEDLNQIAAQSSFFQAE